MAIHEAREAAKHARYAHGNGIVSGIPVYLAAKAAKAAR